jgi:NTP pyrophosphatase (non-canonical NTP hydrolase)
VTASSAVSRNEEDVVARLRKRTVALLAAGALGVGGATLGWAASGGDKAPAAELADALNKNEGTNLTEADVRQAMEDVFKARLDAAVKAGRLTQGQADEMLQRYKDAPRRHAQRDARRAERIAPVAKVLGMTADEIRSALRSGKTLAKLAEEKGMSRAALLAAIKEGIQAAAKADGRTLSAERLNEMAARMADATGPGDRGGHRGRGHGGFGPGGFGPGGLPPLGP